MYDVNIAALHLEREVLGARARRAAPILFAAGAVLLAASYGIGMAQGDGLRHFGFSYLVSYLFFLTIMLGAQAFILLQHVTRARWSVVVRRLAEMVAALVPVLALLFIPIMIHSSSIYEWRTAEGHSASGFKSLYFQPGFVLLRVVVYFAAWWLLGSFFLRCSVGQDGDGDPERTRRLERRSAPALFGYAILITYFSFDVIMSLDMHWYSTMYGVYVFAGSLMAFLALLALLSMGLQRHGLLLDIVTQRHYHDIGRLLFAFVMFWAYIAFSQYMLIWYANIPEETVWVLHRQTHGWGVVSVILILAHFALPFLGLMSRHMKTRLRVLAFWCGWLLAAHWLDLYWQVMPNFSPGSSAPHLLDATCLLGLGAVMAGALLRSMSSAALVPTADPRLAESLVGSH